MEVNKLKEYDVFQALAEGAGVPEGYSCISLHWVFNVKHDFRHQARIVAGGHVAPILDESPSSSVVSLKCVRLLLFLSQLNKLNLTCVDIGNAYFEAETMEKVFAMTGPEFEELEVTEDKRKWYMSMVGMGSWCVQLCRIDNDYAVNSMASYRHSPSESHLSAVLRIFVYVKSRGAASTIFRTEVPDYSLLRVKSMTGSSNMVTSERRSHILPFNQRDLL